MSLRHDVRAELVRARAYRISWITWLLIAAIAVGFVAFGVTAVQGALAAGEDVREQVQSVAFLPGMSTGITGLLVAILATTLTTADEGSGTAHSLRMMMSDRRIIAARAAMVGLIVALATTITTLIAILGAVMLPATLLWQAIGSATFWVNVAGTLLVHLTWGLLALAFASWWPRAAVSMGGVLAVMLGLPSVEMALRALQWETGWFKWLPEALTRAATVTGAEAVTPVAAPVAIVCLTLWCVGLTALASVGTSRLRRA